nr:reverse transcriptase domain-containing protein [Tanacetum cinerariifolium]
MQQLKIPEWKMERTTMDFITKLPRTGSGHDAIWVIMDRLTKSAHFLPMCEDYKMDRLARLYLNEIVARYDVPVSIISDQSFHIKVLAINARGTRNPVRHEYVLPPFDRRSELARLYLNEIVARYDVPVSIISDQSFHIKVLAINARGTRNPAKVRKEQLIGPELVQETIEKISHIKDRLKAVRNCQKSYVDKRRKPLEFSEGSRSNSWEQQVVSELVEKLDKKKNNIQVQQSLLSWPS